MKWLLAAAGLVIVIGGAAVVARPEVVEIAPGTRTDAVVASAPEGSILRLLPGEHVGFQIDRRVTVEAMPGAVVLGTVAVTADDVTLRGLRIVGGESGISIRGASGVEVLDVSVWGADLHGIEVSAGSATITGCSIDGLLSPFAQGVEVRNANGMGHTVVQGCRVSSGQEGLVSHVARVAFRDNVIVGSTQRAIAVTEMSEGIAEGNSIRDVMGSALYCGDMSHCEFRSNQVRRVVPNPNGTAWQQGFGAVGIYHSRMMLEGNTFEDLAAARPVRLSLEATQTDRSPVRLLPDGPIGALPALWVTGIAAAGLVLVGVAVRPLVRRRVGRLEALGASPLRTVSAAVAFLIVAGVIVQGFHMLEHVVQVFQVYVAEGAQRSGLLGAVVDTEWVHFVYNAGVLAFLAVGAVMAWRGRFGSRGLALAGVPLVAALLIQTYHFAEHAAKVIQHVSTGATPAPGLIGGRAGLVWFHFGINLAVYAGLVVGVVHLARSGVFRSLTHPEETTSAMAASA
jgi:hypothetical protein